MKRNKEFKCYHCDTFFTRPKNRLENNRINPEKLKFCDDCFKVCIICENRHGKNGDTCSLDCTKKAREQTNLEKYGYSHNWNKGHPGRESCENTMFKKYGVIHNFQKSELRKKQDENIKNKYGVSNIFQLSQTKEKIKETNLEKFGVENPSQNNAIHEKKIKTSFKRKKYIMPSGHIEYVLGYEPFEIDRLLQLYDESELIIDSRKMPEIWYVGIDGLQHRYFPDIFIPKDNKIIEVKSERTMLLHLETNIIKKIRCLEMGFQFEFRIYDRKMNSIDEKEFLL